MGAQVMKIPKNLRSPPAFKRPFHLKFSRRAGSGEEQTADFILPPELWQLVFSFLSGHDQRSLTLTCWHFRLIAQALLFNRITVHPYNIDNHPHSPMPSNVTKHKSFHSKQLERLSFYQKPHISSSVTRCSLVPDPVVKRPSGTVIRPMDDIVDTTLDTLPLFPNLAKLTCHSIKFSNERLDKLRELPLRSIAFDTCVLTADAPTPLDRIPLKTIVWNHTAVEGQPEPNPTLLSLFLHSPILNRLAASPPEATLTAMLSVGRLTSLKELELPLASVGSRNFIPALSACPNVTSLQFIAPKRCHHVPQLGYIPYNFLPNISNYRGPYKYLNKLCDRKKLVFLHISIFCSAENLIATLFEFGICESLESLTTVTRTFPSLLLQVIQTTFPALVRLKVLEPFLSPAEWLTTFWPSEPFEPHHYLRGIQFGAEIEDVHGFWVPPPLQIQEALTLLSRIHPTLVHTYPCLKRLQLIYTTSLERKSRSRCGLLWQPTLGGAFNPDQIVVEVDMSDPSHRGRPLLADEKKLLRAFVG